MKRIENDNKIKSLALPIPILIIFGLIFVLMFLAIFLLTFKNPKNLLPTCDSNEITNTVIEQFKETSLIKNNPYYTLLSAKIITPTTTKYDKDIPRYECVAKIEYKYNFQMYSYVRNNLISYVDVNYSVSKSLGETVIYANYEY